MNSRVADWHKRLARVTELHQALAGAWGVSDCWIATLDAVEAVTGNRIYENLRAYRTEAGGWRAFHKAGFETIAQAFAAEFATVNRLSMQRGDIGVVERNGVMSAGFMTTRGFAVKTLYEAGGSELVFMPVTAVVAGFKVGRD